MRCGGIVRIGCLLAAMLAPLSGMAADAQRGKVIAHVRCAPCHHLETDARNIGPSLKGIFGRAPSIAGVPFRHWDAAALDRWLANPRAVKPNTRMQIPPISARDRADIIAYFRWVKERGRI